MKDRNEAFNRSQELFEDMFRDELEAERKLNSGQPTWRQRMVELDKKVRAKKQHEVYPGA